MTVATQVATDAASTAIQWHNISWPEVHEQVRRLQVRIAKATREKKWRKVKALQWLLTHSLSAKALAVKRVTENQGKKTPGVDGETWSTPVEKSAGIQSLRRHGYKPKPLRRVLIPKANGKTRPLGARRKRIPAIVGIITLWSRSTPRVPTIVGIVFKSGRQ